MSGKRTHEQMEKFIDLCELEVRQLKRRIARDKDEYEDKVQMLEEALNESKDTIKGLLIQVAELEAQLYSKDLNLNEPPTPILTKNPCLECGVEMGNSTRQLCGKTQCEKV
jgi:hypothetical protein